MDRGASLATLPAEDVAVVNNTPLLRTDFIARTEEAAHKLFGETSDTERGQVLSAMIREELFVQHGLTLKIPERDPETREHLVDAVERQVTADIAAHPPTEAQLEHYFQEHHPIYATEGSMTLRNLRLAAGPDALATARRAVHAIEAGTPPAEAMKNFGLQDIGPGTAAAEQFYFAERIHLGDALFAEALKLDDGQVSGPILAADGVHILMMVKHTRPVPQPFAQVRSRVLSDYVAAAGQRLETALEQTLRAQARIRIADDLRAAYATAQP
ncbi:MAG: peptidyl-prolyl cis-trans isomerase [Alphaproteobacteria bacterium]|nr:peptidyl-prolyl cis-trans isomerase [Alphaproteobacteria bacterium]